MRKIIILLMLFFNVCTIGFSQIIEKIGTINSLTTYSRMNTVCPSDTFVDEINNILICRTNKGKLQSKYVLDDLTVEPQQKEYFAKTTTEAFVILDEFEIHYSIMAVEIKKDNKVIVNCPLWAGISFILKKGSGYIVYYVDGKGIPGAADTEGKIYNNKEAVEYLKQYDSEKYEESLLRTEEIGLKEKFLNNEVLVWGETYYSTINILEKFYARYPFISSDLIQYDQNGYGYQMIFDYDKTKLCIINPDGRNLSRSQYEGYADFLKNDYSGISTSWYVGFGGNIYYYIAGEEYTEVFRIRRTWGDPDFYAMAVNGYTEDEYGKYVNEVLTKLSKADLRLLRNTVFALYGVHFKSDDLAKHFDKQVWYTDEGKTSAEVTLSAHRQKLVEMIMSLEK